MVPIQGAKTPEARVDHPELIFGVPRELVNIDVAGDVDASRQIARVVLTGRLQLLCHGGEYHTVLVPPMVRRARSPAIPMGLPKVRKWVLRTPSSLRMRMTLPAW
jgi:hypothetical protein